MTEGEDVKTGAACTQSGSNAPAGGRGGGDAILARVQSELALVDNAAKQIYRSINGLIEFEELVSAGREGLVEAATRFDPDLGVPFRVYASYRVRGAIFDAIRKASWLPRRSQERLRALQAAGFISEGSVAHVFVDIDSSRHGGASVQNLDDHLAAIATAAELSIEASSFSNSGSSETDDPEAACATKELLELVRQELDNLNPSEAHVIRLLFFEHQSLEEAAQSLNRLKPWACRLQTRGIERLTRRLRHLIE